ncbi:hypothetical protein MRX96_010034 [Rhipicephalus microplus]
MLIRAAFDANKCYAHPPSTRNMLLPRFLTRRIGSSIRLQLAQGCTVLHHVTSRASSPGAPPRTAAGRRLRRILRLNDGCGAVSPVYIPGTPPRTRRSTVRGVRAASGAVTSSASAITVPGGDDFSQLRRPAHTMARGNNDVSPSGPI